MASVWFSYALGAASGPAFGAMSAPARGFVVVAGAGYSGAAAWTSYQAQETNTAYALTVLGTVTLAAGRGDVRALGRKLFEPVAPFLRPSGPSAVLAGVGYVGAVPSEPYARFATGGGMSSAPGTVGVPISMAMAGRREALMGGTPKKDSRTGRDVIERMRAEGTLKSTPTGIKVLYENAGKRTWVSVADCDMAHRTDAVKWWNWIGKYFGEKSQPVRDFMLDPDNYVLEPYWANRSKGAGLGLTYDPPEPPAYGDPTD